MAHKRRNPSGACPNCATALADDAAFCPRCGQENHDLRVPFRWFLLEFVGNITSFDTKLWNTLRLIFTKPGALARDYADGKRARYVNPARFYVFVSLFFFALLTLWFDRSADSTGAFSAETDPELRRTAKLADIITADSLHATLDELSQARLPIDAPYYRSARARLSGAAPHVLDSLLSLDDDTLSGTRSALRHALAALPEADSLNVPYSVYMNGVKTSFTTRGEEKWFRTGNMTEADVDSLLGPDRESVGWFKRRMIRSLGRIDLVTPKGRKEFSHTMLSAVSLGMFLLMPFAAVLLLWFFSWRRYYWEHLIFSVHLHTVLFLFVALVLGVAALVGATDLPGALLLVMALVAVVYMLAALRRFYRRSWASTILRLVAMGLPYLVVLVIMISAGALWGFISL